MPPSAVELDEEGKQVVSAQCKLHAGTGSSLVVLVTTDLFSSAADAFLVSYAPPSITDISAAECTSDPDNALRLLDCPRTGANGTLT